MNYKPYPKYKKSNIKWLGEIPQQWNDVKLKFFSSIIMGQSPDKDFVNDLGNGLPFFQGKSEFGNKYPVERKWCTEPTKIANSNDVLISVRAPVGDLNIATKKCCIGRGLSAIRFKNTKIGRAHV